MNLESILFILLICSESGEYERNSGKLCRREVGLLHK